MRVARSVVLTLALTCCATACSRATVPAAAPATLRSLDGARQSLGDLARRSPWTVLVFVSSTCPCMAAHRDRLEDLAAGYGPRGVQFAAVESEVEATPQKIAKEAEDYSVPLLVDDGARVANELGAEYVTYTVIVDREGHVLYKGGLDSDKVTLHPDATFYVRDALDDLLAGKRPRRAEGKTLGCMLRKW